MSFLIPKIGLRYGIVLKTYFGFRFSNESPSPRCMHIDWIYKTSLNVCFTRVSCTLNRVSHKQNCWLGRVIKWRSFIRWERSFNPMELIWLGYIVYSLGNCVMKLCIETDLTGASSLLLLIYRDRPYYFFPCSIYSPTTPIFFEHVLYEDNTSKRLKHNWILIMIWQLSLLLYYEYIVLKHRLP